jgi:hypothetical protein
MHTFAIPRLIPDSLPHLSGSLPAVCVKSAQEIPAALSAGHGLNFQLSEPVIVLLGVVPAAGDADAQAVREVVAHLCDEVIGPLGQRHSVAVVTDGADGGIAGMIGQTRAAFKFRLIGVKRATESDEEGENVDLHHSHLLTVRCSSDAEATAARLVAAQALAREIGPVHYRAIVVLLGGDQSTWNDVRMVMHARLPLVIVEGSGGIADEIARVRTYQGVMNRPYIWSVESPPVAPYPLQTLDLQAAGFLALYREPGMNVSFLEGTDDSSLLYAGLKREFNIHSRE